MARSPHQPTCASRVEAQRLSAEEEQTAERRRDVERERRGDTAPGSAAANAAAARAASAAVGRQTRRKLSNEQIQKMLPELDDSLRMQAAARVFTTSLRALLRDRSPGPSVAKGLMWKALVGLLWGGLLRAVALYLGHMLCGIATPLVCWALLLWMQQEEPPLLAGLLLVCALGLCSGLSATFKEYFSDRCNTLGLWTMSAVRSLSVSRFLCLILFVCLSVCVLWLMAAVRYAYHKSP
jgi:hypothetical protein